MFRPLPLLAAFLTLAVAVPVRANCGAEGCPLSPLGPEASGGRFSLDVGHQFIEQDRLEGSGEHEHDAAADAATVEILTRTRAWTVTAGWQVLPAFTLRATVPWLQRTHVHDHEHHPGFFERSTYAYEGLGDAHVLAHWRAFGTPGDATGEWSFMLGGKLPTGDRHIEVAAGEEEPEPPVRLGTGSTDGVVGLGWSREAVLGSRVVPVSVTVLGRLNGRGTDGYRVGNELQGNVSASYALHPVVHAIAQLNAISHGHDDAGETHAESAHTGGRTLYLTPGLRVSAPGGLGLYAYWQMRTYQHSHGPQLVAPDHLIVGANVRLGR